MDSKSKNNEREERIEDEIVVDAYGEYERAASWHVHLEDRLNFPFKAKVIKASQSSPLKENEIVTAVSMADIDDLNPSMRVIIKWKEREFSVPLEQLYPTDASDCQDYMIEAIEDWHYWVEQGYLF